MSEQEITREAAQAMWDALVKIARMSGGTLSDAQRDLRKIEACALAALAKAVTP